jgi:hypothetical protein
VIGGHNAIVVDVAINPEFIDKVHRSDRIAQARFNDTFVNRQLTARELLEEIRLGHAFTATHRRVRHPRPDGTPSRFRCRENFLSAQHLALDFDDRGFDDLLAEPFIMDHAAFLYTTASHTPAAPRSRAIFILDRAIGDAEEYATFAAALARHFRDADPSCTDPARAFFGAQECDSCWLGNLLTLDALAPLVDARRRATSRAGRRATVAISGSSTSIPLDPPDIERVRRALACIPPDAPELPYNDWIHILMGVHSAFPGEVGIALVEGWSPGYEDEVAEKFATFDADRDEKWTLGTVFWHAKRHGWRDTPRHHRAEAADLPPDEAVPTVSLADAVAEVKRQVDLFLRDEVEAGSTLVITAQPGVGKTTAIIDAVRALPTIKGAAIWALAPRHKLYSEDWADAGVRQVRGRNPDNCVHHVLVKPLGDKGLPINDTLCAQCHTGRRCAYFEQFDGHGHHFATLPILNTSYPKYATAVVLDELTPDHFIEEFMVDRDELLRRNGDPATDPPVRAFVEALLCALPYERERERIWGVALLGRVHWGPRHHLRRLAETALAALDAAPVLAELTASAVAALPSIALHRLAGEFLAELDREVAGTGLGSITLDLHAHCYRVKVRRELPDWMADMPLIILNATADPATLLDLLGRDPATATVVDPHVALPPAVEIVQLSDAYYGKTTLGAGKALGDVAEGPPTLRHALDRVRATLDPTLSTGLITFMNIERAVAAELGIPPERVAHYGAVAGSNAMKELEQLVLLGACSTATADVWELARAIFAGREPLVEGEGYRSSAYPGYLDANGHRLAFDIRSFADPRVQRLYEESREGAMLQAAHRLRLLRPNGRKRVRLIVATALPLPGLPPTAIRRDETADPRTRATRGKLADAARDLVAREGYATRKAIADMAGVDKQTVRAHWRALLLEEGLLEERRVLRGGTTIVAVRPDLESFQEAM